MLRNIENNSTFYEVLVNNTNKIGNVRIYKGTFNNLKENDTNAHYFRRKTFVRKQIFNRIVRV